VGCDDWELLGCGSEGRARWIDLTAGAAGEEDAGHVVGGVVVGSCCG
jgi:hypothetical protein